MFFNIRLFPGLSSHSHDFSEKNAEIERPPLDELIGQSLQKTSELIPQPPSFRKRRGLSSILR
ncbi:hypothetical protein JW824_11090 [bacterium]|nr:hypothetical protein [bacterium]